jgi:hypothetical protein
MKPNLHNSSDLMMPRMVNYLKAIEASKGSVDWLELGLLEDYVPKAIKTWNSKVTKTFTIC